MRRYFHFVGIGLILALFTEAVLKLVAGINPPAFLIAVAVYPVVFTLFFGISRFIDRKIAGVWKGDVLHYAIVGFLGLAFEWFLLGNGPDSNAIQLGMIAMWTTFGFGPRILTRAAPLLETGRRRFWLAFAIAAVLLIAVVWMAPERDHKVVFAVYGLSGTYAIWSVWLLILSWTTRIDTTVASGTAE